MNTQFALLHHLRIDEVEVENSYFETYMRYCLDLSIRFNLYYQNVLANRSVSLWYRNEFQKLEKEAISMLDLSQGDLKEKRTLYASVTARIFARHPSALLDELKKVEIINPSIPYN